MIDDYSILGLEATKDIAKIKSAFRKRAKELHPDLAREEDVLKNHDLFVEVCAAYRRLVGGAEAAPKAEPARGSSRIDGTSMAPYGDQAYAFYKTGMKCFMSIHPSRWNIDKRMLNTKIAGDDEEQEDIRRNVMELVKLFPKAYYYFGIVVHEYPDSNWACDAQEKMTLIEERIGMYRRIIESFSSWNVDKAASSREYQEKYNEGIATLKAVRRDEPRGWKDGR